MIRCSCCVMPSTRPDTPFVDGVCAACLSYSRRPMIDWEERKAQLVALLDRHDGRCIVPSSGGKDSSAQVLMLQALGADVTCVTARTCHLTPIGRANIDNLARHARTIEVVPNMTVRAKLNRLGLELVGDISWPEHASIFCTPLRIARDLKIPLLFYGENPQSQWGGPLGTDDAMQMTARWVSEFGGFLGLRADDFVGMEGITDRDMDEYRAPVLGDFKPERHFLGQYLPWDSHANAGMAKAAGMTIPDEPPCEANWWRFENADNAQTGAHDYFMWLKYGFGRGCQQISSDVRTGLVKRDHALTWVEDHDGLFPAVYAGVAFEEMIDRIGLPRQQFNELARKFTAEA